MFRTLRSRYVLGGFAVLLAMPGLLLWNAQHLMRQAIDERFEAERAACGPLLAAAIGALLLALATTWLTSGFRRLSRASRCVADGDDSTRLQPTGVRELDAVSATFRRMAETVQDQLAQRTDNGRYLRRLIDTLSEGLAAMAPDLRVLDCNEALLRLFGTTRAQFLAAEPVELGELVAGCLPLLQAQADERRITLAAPPPPAPCRLLADRKRLRQVLANCCPTRSSTSAPAGSSRSASRPTRKGSSCWRCATAGAASPRRSPSRSTSPSRASSSPATRSRAPASGW